MYLCVSVLEADTHQIHSQIHRYKVYKTADKLVYCHEAMHVQLRMQDAGWSADVERWESDEDSDGSEEADGEDVSEAAVLRLSLIHI